MATQGAKAARSCTSLGHDQTYAIVGSPRSGSNFLCQLIRNCGVLGNPAEYFNDRELRAARLAPAEIAERIWSEALRNGTSANGVRAVKVFPALLERWPCPQFIAQLPHFSFVQLRRRDLVDQAVSWAIGLQTMRWASFVKGWDRQPRYKPKLIRQCLVTIASDNAFWDRTIADWGSQSITLYYEDIQRDALAAINRIADLVGVDRLAEVASDGEFTVQRDAINLEFRARFLHDHCGALGIIEGASR